MRISYNWLKQYLELTEKPEVLAGLLTDCGLEVESMEDYESVRGGLDGVVIGQILSCTPHPNADRLSLALVDTGRNAPVPVVCGAPNVAEGQKVLLATVGTTLYPQGKALPINKAKIRGEASEGMICAEDELGLGDSHEGIMVLPDSAPIGLPAAEYFRVYKDWVFEIGLTPNRIDAASHIGVARDLAAVLNHQAGAREFLVKWPDVSAFVPERQEVNIPVRIEDPDACPRYSSVVISGLNVKESPDWLQNKLKAIGLKPINNVVDATNFVLHELGQPLHAFDLAAIKGNEVIVKKSPKGTRFVTLDEEELMLSGEDLMICNAEEPMCMGGIFGGINSGVTRETRGIFLESACFDPVSIRKSSRLHGLKTDASFRFERGSDPAITVYALKRAVLLIKELAGGETVSAVQDVYPQKKEPATVDLNYERVYSQIGKRIPAKEVKAILADLDFDILQDQPDGLHLSVPTYRVDVSREADVIEEILRIYGYNNVDVPSKMQASIVISPKPDKERLREEVSAILTARGFHEIMNNSLTRASYYDNAGFDSKSLIAIENPLSQDLNAMRQSLLFGGLETIVYNGKRQQADMKLYEFGNVYQRSSGKVPSGPLPGYHERMVLALFLSGRRQPETWRAGDEKQDFFDLKNSTYSVLARLGIDPGETELRNLDDHPHFVYCTDVYMRDRHIARLGLLAADLLKKAGSKEAVYYGEVEWESLVALASEKKILYDEVPRYPAVRRDLALLLDRQVPFSMIEEIACRLGNKLLRSVSLFDVYQDDKIGKDKKSYAVSFLFQDAEKTLTDKEVDKVMERLTKAYGKELNASLR